MLTACWGLDRPCRATVQVRRNTTAASALVTAHDTETRFGLAQLTYAAAPNAVLSCGAQR